MRINEIGGEFALIERLQRIVPTNRSDVLVGIGDDAAVLNPNNDDFFLLVTTDTMVENAHFVKAWSRPEQIGIKASESNISDIAAMGGIPTCMFVSLVLSPDTTVEWVERLYEGLAQSCNQHRITVGGGDTTHGAVTTISITLLGKVNSKNLCLRSHAKPGDRVLVTGPLGGSAAGLNLLQQKLPATPYLIRKHFTPNCRLETSRKIASFVNAMIDVSDGLASEVNHICTQSRVGAKIFAKKIPLHSDVVAAGKRLDVDPLLFALNGGEDYELLFTISPENLELLCQKGEMFFQIGCITDKSEGCVLITPSDDRVPLKGGYNHFE